VYLENAGTLEERALSPLGISTFLEALFEANSSPRGSFRSMMRAIARAPARQTADYTCFEASVRSHIDRITRAGSRGSSLPLLASVSIVTAIAAAPSFELVPALRELRRKMADFPEFSPAAAAAALFRVWVVARGNFQASCANVRSRVRDESPRDRG
jgi:hypothetical protein